MGEWLTRQILAEFQAQETRRDLAQSLDRLDDQMIGLTERLNEIEEHVQANALRDAIEKLHDGLTRLNNELVQTTGSTTIQTSALAAKTAALAGQLDDIRAEAERKTKILEANFEQMGGSLQTRHTTFEDNVARINADISAMRAQFSEKSDAGDQSVAQLENRISETTRHLEELRSAVAATREEAAGSVKTLQQWLQAAFASSSSQAFKIESELEALDAGLGSVRADVSERSRDLDQRLKDIYGQTLARISQLTTDIGSLASQATNSSSHVADELQAAHDRHKAIEDRVTSHETRLASEINSRDADHTAFRSDVLGKVEALQNGLGAVNSATEKNSAATSELSAITDSLERMHKGATEKAGALERELAELREKFDATNADALKISSALSEIHVALQQDSERKTKNIADIESATNALRGDVSRLGSENADKLAGVENFLTNLREQSHALRGELSRLGSESADRLAGVESSLTGLREQSSQTISALKAELDDANQKFGASRDKSAEDLAALEQRFSVRAEQSVSDIRSLAEKAETVDSQLVQIRAAIADTQHAAEPRLAGLEQGLTDLGTKISAVNAATSDSHGALRQLLTQLADQSAGELGSLKAKVESIGGALENHRSDMAQSSAAMKERVDFACQAIEGAEARHRELSDLIAASQELKAKVESIVGALEGHQGDAAQTSAAAKERMDFAYQAIERAEARHRELSDLLAASQGRELAAANAIQALEEKLNLLESRIPAAPTVQVEESVEPPAENSPDAQSQGEQTHGGETADPAAGNAAVETPTVVVPDNNAEKSGNARAADFDEWDYYDDEPRIVLPPVIMPVVTPVAGVEQVSANANPVSSQHQEPEKLPDSPAQNEHQEIQEAPTANISAELPPVVTPVAGVEQVSADTNPVSSQHQEPEMLPDSPAQIEHPENQEIPAVSISGELLPALPAHLLQSDTAQEPDKSLPDGASEPVAPATDAAESTPSDSRSFISAARLAAKAANERADAEQAEVGAFRKYFSRTRDETSSAQKLRKSGVQLGAAAVVLAVCFAAAKYFASSQSVLPRAQADIHVPSASSQTPGAHVVQTGVRKNQAQSIESPAPGTGGNADTKNSLDRTTALAVAGDAKAQLSIGLRYLARENDAASGSEAAKWLGLAAKQGNAVAQYRLGALYAAGHGVAADQAHAAQLYESAANLGNRRAMYNLALAYTEGEGVSKNSPEAVRWFLKAANLGLVDAQFDLAVLYERGTGVPQSLLDAYRWYAIAAKSGDKESQQRVQALATQIPANDQAAAQKSADDFKALAVDQAANNVTGTL